MELVRPRDYVHNANYVNDSLMVSPDGRLYMYRGVPARKQWQCVGIIPVACRSACPDHDHVCLIERSGSESWVLEKQNGLWVKIRNGVAGGLSLSSVIAGVFTQSKKEIFEIYDSITGVSRGVIEISGKNYGNGARINSITDYFLITTLAEGDWVSTLCNAVSLSSVQIPSYYYGMSGNFCHSLEGGKIYDILAGMEYDIPAGCTSWSGSSAGDCADRFIFAKANSAGKRSDFKMVFSGSGEIIPIDDIALGAILAGYGEIISGSKTLKIKNDGKFEYDGSGLSLPVTGAGDTASIFSYAPPSCSPDMDTIVMGYSDGGNWNTCIFEHISRCHDGIQDNFQDYPTV